MAFDRVTLGSWLDDNIRYLAGGVSRSSLQRQAMTCYTNTSYGGWRSNLVERIGYVDEEFGWD